MEGKVNDKRRSKHDRFSSFITLCREIERDSSHKQKTCIMKNHLEKILNEKETDDDEKQRTIKVLYKLLLRKADRRVFNVKDKQLVNIFSCILDECKDDMLDDLDEGDVSETIKNFFERSELCAKRSRITMTKIDSFLDELTTVTKNDDQQDLFDKLISNKLSSLDMKYFIRLITRDLRTFAGEKFLLEALHEDSYNLFKLTNNLNQVVEKSLKIVLGIGGSLSLDMNSSMEIRNIDNFVNDFLKSDEEEKEEEKEENNLKVDIKKSSTITSTSTITSKIKVSTNKKRKRDESDDEEDEKKKKEKKEPKKKKKKLNVTIEVMHPLKPMLARASKSFEDVVKRCKNGMFIEIKYDGERIQIHKKGDKFKFYSRNLKDVTEWKIEGVKDEIKKCINEDEYDNLILDGEILLVDTNTGKPYPFTSFNKHKSKEQKNSKIGIYLFDILCLNGKSLLNIELDRRRKILEKVVKPIKNSIMFSEYDLIPKDSKDQEKQVEEKMKYVIQEGLEGIMIKDVKSVYGPNKRHWIKLKKDYIDGMGDSVDLIVLGAYYGTGSKSGLLSVFLMGVYCKKDKQYKTVCKVGNGHDDETLLRINEEIKDNMKKIRRDYDNLPDWIDCNRELVPDFICKKPEKSVVWEIMGTEFSESRKHTAASISIRFPRVTRIRDDKEVKESTSLEELIKLSKISKINPINKSDKKKSISSTSKDEDSDISEDEPKKTKNVKNGKRKSKRSTEEEDEDDEMEESDEEIEKHIDVEKENKKFEMDKNIENINFNHIYGDLKKNGLKQDREKDRMIIHCLDDRGTWSDRGNMGLIQSIYDKRVKDEYLELFKNDSKERIGKYKITKLTKDVSINKNISIYICTLIVQKYDKSKRTSPILYNVLRELLKECCSFCKKNNVNVIDFCQFHYSVSNLDLKKVENCLGCIVQSNIQLYIFTRHKGDKRSCLETEKRLKQTANSSTSHNKNSASERNNEEGIMNRETKNDKYYIVIDGYSEGETKLLKEKVEKLGGVVQTQWKMIGKTKSTHCICENNCEVMEHMKKLGIKTIKKDWILECEKDEKMICCEKFYFEPRGEQTDLKQKDITIRTTSVSTNISKVTTLDLEDIFEDCKVFIEKGLKNERKLRRFVIAYGGEISKNMSQCTHVICSKDKSSGSQTTKDDRRVNEEWIFNCVKEKKLLDTTEYSA